MSSFSTYSSKAAVAVAAVVGETIHHIRRLSSSSDEDQKNPFQGEMHWRLPMLGIVLVLLAVGLFVLDAIIRCAYPSPYGYFQPPPQRILPVMSIEPALNFSSGLTLAGGADHHPECTICLSEFVEGEKIRILSKCKHGFHDKCIETWLRSRTSCPTCRTSCVKTSIDKNPPESHQQQQQQQQNDIDLEAANRPETEMMVLQQQQPPNDIDVEAANQSETEILSRSSA